MRAGDLLGDHAQRAIALAVIFEPVVTNEDGVGVSAPLTYQSRAGLEGRNRVEGRTALLTISDQGLHTASQRPAHRPMGTLLQLVGQASDQQITTELARRFGAVR